MPATFVSTTPTGNALVDAIDNGFRWSGAITFNRVDPLIPGELAAFAAAMPSIYATAGVGVTDPIWFTIGDTLALLRTYAVISFAATNDLDANYFVSDVTRPDNPNVTGIAARPGPTPILAFNVTIWDDFSEQLQAWIALSLVGRTLGLRQPTDLPPALNVTPYTMMSADWQALGNAETGEGLPLTPMALDVARLQANYGAASSNTGDTTYTPTRFFLDLDGSDGSMANGGGYVCIWDTGGVDRFSYTGASSVLFNLNAATLQTSAYSGDLADVIGDVASLSPIFAQLAASVRLEITDPVRTAGGFFSSFLAGSGRETAGFTIASGAEIEGASGGAGADLIIGNALANALSGNGGDDNLFGGSGADTLAGAAGNDLAYGGLGNDSLLETAGSNYLRGDEGDDWIQGGAGFDDMNGNMGNDTVVAGSGDSWAVGGRDNDSLMGGSGQNLVYGNLGSDTCDGGGGNDIVRGGQDNDLVRGGDGADFLSGDRGDDTLAGGAGADIFNTFAETGLDRVIDFNRTEGDRVQLAPGTQFTTAQEGADVVISMTGGGRMVLVGVQLSSLTDGWIFGA